MFPRSAPAGAGRILVVEADPAARRRLIRVLEGAGFQVEAQPDAPGALAAAQARPPDVILCEAATAFEGRTLPERVRAEPALAQTPLVVFVARGAAAGAAAGADDCVAKPFSARELVARVRTHVALGRARREAGDAVVRSERLLRLAQDAGRIAAWEYEVAADELRATTWSEALWDVPNGSPFRAYMDRIHPEDRPRADAAVAATAATGAPLDIEFRLAPRAGEPIRWLAVRAEGQGPDPRRPRRIIGVTWDVTERRSAEDRLRASNVALAEQVRETTADRDRLWRLTSDVMLVARFDGTILSTNPAWTTLLGWPEAALVGRVFLDFVHPEDRASTMAAMAVLEAGDRVDQFVNRYRTADGSYRFITWSATPDGAHIHAVGRDVTRDREHALELQAAQARLQQAQKMEAIGQLTGGVAHDFNNLLTVIRGSADLLRRGALAPERRSAYLDAIVETADRAANLTRQLLAFSRRQVLNPEPFDAFARLEALGPMMATVLGEAVDVRVARRGGRTVVLADPTHFETAILNLLVNARDAMDGRGAVRIAVEGRTDGPDEAGVVEVSVADDGAGIEPEHLQRIFEPFFTTKAVGRGTGLGLSQVFGFATQSGGEIHVESEPERGAVFTLRLPAAEADAPPAAPPAPADISALRGARILVVEDNREIGDFAVELLEALGARPALARTGEEALARLEAGGFDVDLVFTDVVMPGLSGLELARMLAGRRPELPVVLATGYSHSLAQGAEAGRTVVHKPYALETLAEALSRALQRAPLAG